MPRAIISPSVLASDFGQLTAECKRMIKGGAEWLHMDVMDGHFVPNITMGAPILKCVHQSIPDIFMDCHMMVSEPEKARLSHLEFFLSPQLIISGSTTLQMREGNYIAFTLKRQVYHLRSIQASFSYKCTCYSEDPISLINAIHAKGMQAGVAISPDTPSAAISDEVGNVADMLLVMTVYPGYGGQKFLDRCVPKVADLRKRFPEKDIEVDGGVGPKTVDVCAAAGSNVIVAGSAIFGASNPEEVIATLKASVAAAQAKIRDSKRELEL